MEEYLPISCKCITYGRVPDLEEMLESFLRQEYLGKREFLIVNDYPLQTLHFDHPDVRIINCKETFPTIGDKENFAVENCKYDTIAVCDDDDQMLPNHLQNINEQFSGYDLLHWHTGIASVNYQIRAIRIIGNAGIVYNKQIWEKVGKHRKENAGYDMSFVVAIQKAGGKIKRAVMPREKASFIYNWGNTCVYHMSGEGADGNRADNVLVRHGRHIENLRKQGKIQTGDIELKPHWNRDYPQMLKDYLAILPKNQAVNI